MPLDSPPDLLLTTNEVPGYVEKRFGRAAAPSPKTLAKLRCVGGGPEFVRLGVRIAYPQSKIDAWVMSRISRPLRSTSEAA
jgi:hypothetical protein